MALIQVEITDEIYKQFQAALLLSGEKETVVLANLISGYAHKAFSNILQAANHQVTLRTERIDTNEGNEIKQRMLFENWFKTLLWNGRPYNPVTITAYIGRIENICKDPAFSFISVKNLFAITDVATFIEIQKNMRTCPSYAEYDRNTHGGLSAALKKYEEFLRQQSCGLVSNECIRNKELSMTYKPIHRWTYEEDKICCKRFLENYVLHKTNMDFTQFLQNLAKEVPDISLSSLRMKIQNIKYLTSENKIEDTAQIKGLSQYSMQNKKAFKDVLKELNIVGTQRN